MYESEQVWKTKLEIQVQLGDGARLLGFLFIQQMQRLSDLLNDPREFLPFQSPEGLIIHLRKAAIARITQLDQAVENGRGDRSL